MRSCLTLCLFSFYANFFYGQTPILKMFSEVSIFVTINSLLKINDHLDYFEVDLNQRKFDLNQELNIVGEI